MIRARRLLTRAETAVPLRAGETEALIDGGVWRGTPSQIAELMEKAANRRTHGRHN